MPRTKKKVKSIVKTKVISARVTEVVHELLHQQAEDAGMTLSEFAAQMLMKGRVNTSYVFYSRVRLQLMRAVLFCAFYCEIMLNSKADKSGL